MKHVLITNNDFDVADEYNALCKSAPKSGAVVFFVGLVRDLYDELNEDEKIDYLELEHYPGMTENLCEDIIAKANQRYPFDSVRLVHRVGRLQASDQIVMVSVASRHRENAFQAAQYIMDYLKTRATFWKKEVGQRGEHWLGLKEKDKQAASRWNVIDDQRQGKK